MKKKRKRKRLRLKNVFLFLLFVTLIGFIIYGLTYIKVRTYYVYGNNYLTEDEVLKELKLDKNSSYLLTNNILEKENIKNSKFLKSVDISRTLYLELKISVTEYKRLFYDKNDSKVVLENNEKADYSKDNLPVLVSKIEDENVYKQLVKKMNKVNDNSLGMISEIIYSPNEIDKERFLLSMNDGNYVYVTLTKLKKINEYKSIISTVENKKGILYLDYGNYFVPKE
ncbi:MAG: FtsQ-type POTRA domain-containing protein [Bacilli bacterium]|nr:FtsQ-type POTRA domain-containing protein [Bacilli bacterium]